MEIRDLDYLTAVNDVQEAVKRRLNNLSGDLKISRGLRMVIVQLNEHHVVDLLKVRQIKISWTSSTLRRKEQVAQCYRYQAVNRHVVRPRKKKNRAFVI